MTQPARGSAAPSRDLAGHRILVVEDEPLIALFEESILRDAGAAVLGPANSVPEALRLIRRSAWDGEITAAVLDINLAGATARPVAASLSESGVPFLLVTGYDPDGPAAFPATPRLLKPFEPDALIRCLRALVDEAPRRTARPALMLPRGGRLSPDAPAAAAPPADPPSRTASGARHPVPVAPTQTLKGANH